MQWLSTLLVGVLGATALTVAPFAAGSLSAQATVSNAHQEEVAYRGYRVYRYREPVRYRYYRPHRHYYYRQYQPYYYQPYGPYQGGGVYFRVRI